MAKRKPQDKKPESDVEAQKRLDEGKLPATPDLNPRNTAREAFAKAHQEERAQNNNQPPTDDDDDTELDAADDDTHQGADDVSTADSQNAIDQQQQDVSSQPPDPNANDDNVPDVTAGDDVDDEDAEILMVNGKETRVSKSKVYETGKRALQKDIAATERMKEATQLMKEAERKSIEAETMMNMAKQFAPQGQQQQTPPETSPTDYPDAPDMSKRIADVTHAMQNGTEEEGQAALLDLVKHINTNQQQQMTPEQVQFLVNDNIAFNNAKTRIETQFPDVFGDERLTSMFLAEENKARDNGDNRSYDELYTEIATNLRDWSKSLHKPTSLAGGLQERQSRKQTISTPASGTAPVPTNRGGNPPKPKNNSDKIQEMKKARGQA